MPRSRGPAFTVATPRPLPVEREGDHWTIEASGKRLKLTNLDKVFWPPGAGEAPNGGYTKGDLLAYYYNVAETLLPHVDERPLTLKRMPDGIAGSSFFERRPPRGTPDWVARCTVETEDGSPSEHLMATDPAALLFVVNLGCIDLHPAHARCASFDEPDYLVFDLDPFPPAGFVETAAVAGHVHAALDSLGLQGCPKTSGATGIQIYVPVAPGHTYGQTRGVAGAVARLIEAADPQEVTLEWDISDRDGKVFID